MPESPYPRSLKSEPEYRYLFVIAGESNAGGAAPVSGLPPVDLAPASSIRIWNNSTNIFESLQIGTNNLIGHTGFANNINVGIERGLLKDFSTLGLNEVYLLKAGHGGSTIAQWSQGNATGYLATLTSRYLLAKQAIEMAGFRVKPIFIWWLGLNDAGIPTNAATWKTATQTLFANVRSVLGAATPIYMYKLMTNAPNAAARISYNTEIDSMALSDSNLYPVTIPANAEQTADGTHYTLHGYVTAWKALVDRIISTRGLFGAATRGDPRSQTFGRPTFAMVHTAGTSLAPGTWSTAATLPMVSVYDPEGAFTSNGFRVPSDCAGVYQLNFTAGFTAGCTQIIVSAQVNGLEGLRSPAVIIPNDGIYTNAYSDLGFLAAGDIVTLAAMQANTAGANRTFLTTGLQRPRLTLFRVGLQ